MKITNFFERSLYSASILFVGLLPGILGADLSLLSETVSVEPEYQASAPIVSLSESESDLALSESTEISVLKDQEFVQIDTIKSEDSEGGA